MIPKITQPSHRKSCESQFKAAKLLAALAIAGLAGQALAAPPAANALPTGGKVVAGTAAISQAGNTMNINQSSQRAVINWNSFDVGSKATVNFNQPNSSASTLNYVNSASKSMINGAVNANGQVIFVNNNGVVFGKGAEVNVGGMVATTMNISATEFMSGKDTQVYEGGTTGKIINKGHITGNNINSYIALMAPQVVNTGVITATMSGNNAIALVAGQKVTLKFSGSQFVSVSVDASVVNALISNKLLINAGSGQVIIGANAAQNLMGSLIKNTGTISASDINTSGGKISLTADTIEQSGVIEANSAQATGGNISLKGNNITLASGSKTTATGAAAGGTINVGVNNANNQSVQDAIQNNSLANTVSVQTNATVDASATQNGNGGTINIWSQIKTLVAGSLFAKGGAQGGNGGFIETSSKGNVSIAASSIIDTSAPKGKTGMWTIDPQALIIDSAAASAISNALNSTSVTLDATGSACAFGSCTASQSALIRIMAGADIYSSNTATSLNLIATGGQIDINSNITAGQVYAVAQAINVNGSINTNGGNNSNIYLAGAIINILGNINSNGSNSNNSNNTNSSNLNSANTTTANNRRNGQNGLNADSNTYTSNGGLINILATGDINIGSNSYISANGINGGIITIVSTAGKTTINGIVDSIGKATNGGNIAIVGKTQTDLIGALISSEGLSQGGVINLGQVNNLGNGTILAPPATAPPALTNFVNTALAAAVDSNNSITSSNINLDSQTGINAPNGTIVVFGDQIQINNSSLAAINGDIAIGRPSYGQGAVANLVTVTNSTLTSNRVETSGALLGTDGANVISQEWLLDPTTVTIGTTSSTGSLATDITNQGDTNIKATDIASSVSNGNTVNIVATGVITQSTLIAFTPASGVTGTLILDNHATSGVGIALSGGITSSGAGTVNLKILSGSTINQTGVITATGGPINVVMQSGQSTAVVGAYGGDQIAIGAAITTRGGYVIIDGTGGTIDTTTQTIAAGNNTQGGIYFGASIDTSIAGAASTGNVVLSAVSGALASSATTFINGGTVNSGAGITWNGKQNATAGQYNWGFSINNHSSACPWTAIGDIAMIMNSTSTDASASNPIYISSAITSTSGSVTIASNQTVSGNDLAAVTISGPITGYTGVSITGRTATGSSSGITLNGAVSSTTGPVTIIGTSTTGVAVNGTSAGTLAGQSISVSGTGTTATTVVSLAAMTTNSCSSSCNTGHDISVTANDTAAGANAGISQTGAIAQNANGGNITFTSNNSISVAGPISMVANTSGMASLVSYVNTAGNASSVVNDAPLTVAAGSTSAVNYSILAKGGSINSGPISVPGYISLDNTNGGTVLAANATTGTAILVTGVLTSGAYAGTNAITLKAIAGTGGVGINDTAATDNLIAPVGNITLNSVTSTGAGITYASPITATSGSVSITGTSTTGTAITATGLITGLGITVNGTATTAATITSLGALTVNGLYAAGTTAAPTFISNSSGTYIGAINALPTLISGSIAGTNTGLTGNIQAATVVYAMAGNTSTNANYLLGWGAAGAPLTRMVQLNLQLINGQLIATETAAKTNAIALTTGGGTNINTLWTGGTTATTQSTSLATAGYGIANIGFSGSPIFTNSASGNIVVTGNNTAAGGSTGITQTGAVTSNVISGNITFTSNNLIAQSGAISLVANTAASTQANITYNTTSGNKLSTISTGAITIGAGTNTSAINFIENSNGSALTVGAASMPGYILIDNACSACGTPLTPATAAASLTTGVGVTVSGALSAANYISIAGINTSTTNAAVALGANTLTVTNAASFPTAGVNAISVIGYKNSSTTSTVGSPAISSTGALAVQSAGGDVLFQSNGDITQTGGLTLSANTTTHAQNVKYDTTSGNGGSAITIGAITSQGASISAPVNVTVVATGAITQTGAWAFAPATGITGTLILDNHLTQGSSITSSGGITSSGAGTVNLQFLAGGQLIVSGAITASSGPINVVMQSYWKTSTFNSGLASGATVLNTAPITTRGGYVIMDGTGGTIDLVNQTITMGTVNVGYLQNIYPQASINTTTNAGVVSATSTGGNFIGAGYDAVSGANMGAYESSGATLNIGGFVNIQAKSAGTNQYGYVISGYGAGPINAAGNITITANSSSTGIVGQDIYLSAGTTLTSYTGSVNISNTSTGNGSGITINAAISAATGITINNTNVGAIGVQSNAAGTLTATAGTISITSTSTGSGVYAESLAGLITAPKVTITGTNSTAGGLGASVTGGVTITNVAGTYASVGDALNITTTVGTNGTAGGINVTTGAITNNSNGGDVTFKTNGDITATSAVSFATANTTNHVQTLTYDTRTGNLNSQITAGIFTFNATGATSKVNYQILSNGSALTVPAVTVSGTILLDNTCASNASYTCSTPLTASSATTVNTTASVGISLTGAQISGQGITINGINASASNAAVALGANGLTVTSAASFPTAGVNAITVTGLHNTANIGAPGITSTGAIAVQSNGGDVLFQSNGKIVQTGSVTIAANTSGHIQAVAYITTSGNSASTISSGSLSITGTSSDAINYSAITSGASITTLAIGVPGYILLDMTNGGVVAASASTSSIGITVNGNLSAGNLSSATNGIGLFGLSTTATAVSVGSFSITNGVGNIVVSGFESSAGGATGVTIASGMASTSNSIIQNANGGSILIKSNNAITHGGNISIAQNTSGIASNIIYDTTYGNKLSTINASNVSFNGTSTSFINYSNIASGAPIIINSALVVPGSITFDNTYLAGVQGGINATNAWQYGTTASNGLAITCATTAACGSLNANFGIYLRGVVGASTSSANQLFDAVSIYGVAPLTFVTTGTFAAGQDAINIVGITPQFVVTTNALPTSTVKGNAIGISGAVTITNNSNGGNTNIIAYNGRYSDAVSITNASTAGAIEVSAIGTTADIVTVAGTIFTQNSNAGVFIATTNNGNVTPPKIVNAGTGPVVIEAGAYLAVGTVNSACSATDCGQITAISGNSITSANGNVYLYAGSPGVTAGTTSTEASLGLLSPSLGDFTLSNTLFSQAYAAGNVAATSLPIFTLGGINTANVAGGTGGTSWNTGAITSTNTGPVIQFRISPSYTATLSGNVTKVYGTNDPLASAGNINTVGSLDYQLQALYDKTANNSGWVSNGTVVGTGSSAITCASTAGCALITVNSVNFVVPLGAFVNSLQALPPTPRASYGTLAGEQVNTNSTSYAYNITSTHGISVSSGVTINSSSFGNVGLVITPAPLTITASNQAVQAGTALPLGTTAFTSTGLITTVDGVTLGDSITRSTLTSNGLTTVPTTLASGVYAPPNVNSITPSAAVFAPVSGSRGAANYAITYVGGTLTSSTNAIVTITALADTKIYGNSTTTNGVTYNSNGLGVVTIGVTSYSISGLPVGDTLTGLSLTSLGGIATAPVGSSYQITPSAAVITGTVPYTLNYVSALMTVQPRPITIAAVGITTTYGTPVTVSQNLTTGYTIGGSGLGASDTLTSVAVNYYNGTTNSTTVPGSTGAATYNAAITTSAATGTGGFNSTNYNITYTPANLVVNKLAVSLTANSQSTVYGTALALGTTAYTSSLSSLPNGDTISGVTLQYNSSATVPGTTNALTYTGGIVASSATGTGGFGATNYAITYSPGNLTVTPANVVITPVDVSASGQTVMYSGATQTFNPSTGFNVTGMQNSQALVFSTNGLASGLNVGTYANTITTSGSNPTVTGVTNGGSLSNYSITVASQGSLTITPAPLIVIGATSSQVYNGSLQNNGNPVVSGLLGIDTQSGNGVTVTGKSSGTNAGTYNDALSVTAAGATQLSNYTITKTNGSLVISKLAATVTGATTVNPYTGLLQTNTYTTTGILSGDTANVTIAGSAAATHVSQGTVPDVFSVSGSASGNYAFTYAPGSITITPVALSVVGANTTQVYNATTQTNSVATVTGLKASDTATIGGSYGAGKNVGTYADALTVGLSNSSDYTIGVTNGSITITPATITISGITANNKVYNATTAATLNIGTITYSGVFAGDTVSVNTSNLSGTFVDKNVGTAKTVNISGVVLGGSSSANYQLSGGANTTTTANITPAPLTITGSNLTTTYNGAAQSLTSPTVVGVIAGDNVVVATTGGTGTNAGAYSTSYAASGTDAGNYTVTSNTPTLTINKASLVVTANNASSFYGQVDPALTASVAGLQGSDTAPTYTVTRAPGTAVGPYAITASGVSSNTNYNISYVPGVFTISPTGVLVITMNAAATTYGTAATPTTATVQYATPAGSGPVTVTTLTNSSGNIWTDGSYSITITPSITSVGVTPVVSGLSTTWNVGSYTNAVSNTNNYTQSGSPFSGVSTITNTLTITPAPLTLTVADVSKTYNANAVTAAQITAGSLTGGVANGVTVTGGALMNSQTIAGLGGVVYTGAAVGAINASSTPYAINGSVGSGFSNYAVTVVPGALTVNTAPLVVNGALTTRTYNGTLQTNAAATIAGLQGSDTLTVAGLATGTHAGTTADALVATGAAASNYSITYNNGALTINPAALLVTGANNQYAYNGALQTNTGASVSGLKGSDTATVAGYATATHVAQGIVPDVLVATVSSPADYTVTYVQGSLQITPIVITAAVNTATVMYNAASQTTGFVVTGLKGTDTATAASGTATGTNVGTYTSNLVLNTSSDYTVGAITNGTLTITPAPLTISGGLTANNKVYDTTNAATIGVTGNQTLAGVLGTDAVTVSSTGPYTGATFTQSNVGSGLTVTPATTSSVINGASYTTMAGVTLGGAAAGNYYVAGVGPQTLTANITPAPLTISSGLTANNKAYDGTTAATISSATQTLAGVLVSDVGNVAISSSGPYTGAFSQSNVGTGLAVSASTTPTTIAGGTYNAMTGVTLSGSAQGNYYVAGLSAPIAANITPYIINFGSGSGPNIAAVANNKVYTSTTAANGSLSMVNLFGTDSVSVSYTSAAFASPNVATGATVTFNGVTLSGASAANYSIGSTPVTATANITPALLTITAVDKSSFYSQGLATLTQAPAVGLLGSDAVTGAAIATTATTTGANAAVGTYPITISAATGSGLSNYSINYVPATYTIVGPGALAITTAGVTTPYGTGTSGNIVAPALPTATYTTGGTNISSLTYVSSSTTGDVTSYVFRDAALNTVTFNLTPSNTTTSTSNNINVGSYAYAASNLSAVATSLTSAIPSGNFTVTPLAVTITAPAATHAYNGAVQTQLAATASPAILTNDLVTVSGAASGKNVGVYGSNLATSGLDAGNYNFTYVNANLTITPFIIGSGGSGAPSIAATANNKVYDTTTVASGALAMTNLFAGDSVSVAYTSAAFASPNVANGLTVSFSGVTLSGAAAANYSVASVPTATANITPAPLTISAGLTANNKVYDTTNAATIAVTGTQSLAGVLGTDVVSVSSTGPYTGATFSQSNVGSGLTVTPATSVVNGVTTMTGVTLTGAAANNYYVAGVGPQTLVANITPAPLTINAGLTANNKAYDGTTAATISSASQTLAGVLAADLNNVAVSSSGPYNATFASKNVANGITVTPNTTPTVIAGGTYNAMSGVTLSGSAASNYYVTGTASPITANITPYIINFGSGTGPNITAVADSKVYTSTNTANGALSMVNLFPGDSVAVSYATATFASSNVANGITVTFNTPALSGASAANYSIGSTAITAPANITPAPLTITAVNKSSFYSQSLATLTQAPAVGLLGSDTVTGATISTTASTTGVNASAGAYPIAISAATGSGIGNYSITYIPATYTIVAPGALMITTAGATTPYGTSTSGNIITPAQPVASYSTGGSNISALTFVSAATVGNVTSYVYRDATSALVSFNLIPTGTTTSTSGNIVVGSYAYAASNLVSASSGLTSGSAIASGNLTVTPLAVTITAPTTAALTYNGQVQTQGPAVASPAILTNDLVTVSGAASGKNVGVYGSNLAVSGADASNYTFTLVNKNITITPYVVTPGSTTGPRLTTAANSKVYDTTTAATGSLAMAGLFPGDSVAVNYSSAAFASANVNLPASPQTVTFSGVTLSGASASNYSIASGAITATANITPAPVSISGLVANNKVYTSTTADVISGTPIVTGLLGSDTSTATGTAVGTFASPNVANGISVAADLSGMTLSNSNYVITGLTAPLAANITPAPLTISSGLYAQNKVYDTTTAGMIAAIGTQTLAGTLGSDAANLAVSSSGPYTGSFSQASIGNGLTVSQATVTTVINGQSYTTMAGVTLSGSAAGNYYVTGPTTALTANITKAPLTITAINQASFVTQPTGALTYASIGLLGSDTISAVTLATAASNIQPAGQYAITASNATGAAIGNYQVTYAPGTYTIVPAGQLLIQSSGAVTPYTTAATFANPTVAYATSSGAVINNLYLTASSTVNGITTYTYSDGAGASLSFNFAPKNPVISGSNNVSVGTYGLSAANFVITGNNITNISPVVTGDLTVTPRAITIIATPATYVYNGTVRVLANNAATAGIVAGDLVTVADLTGGKNVGNYFSALTTTGVDAKNYQASFVNANLKITPYVLGSGVGGPAISATANNKVYNSTTDATGSLAMTGLFPGDVVAVNFTSAAFANPSVNNGVTVTFNGVTLSGADAANYVLGPMPVTATANITPVPSEPINNMAIVQQQATPEFVPERPTYLINKGDLIYVRDKDDLPKYLQAIEVPPSGAFKFPVPDQIIQELINLSGENVTLSKQVGSYKLLLLPNGSRLVVTLPDDAPLPAGIRYDAASKGFSVPKLGEVTLPLSVKVTLMRGNKVLSQKIMVVTK
ncbi:hypothetical protein G6717_03750 [Polynucleobacter paneuropaeus]|nr:hypothetical protein [Polynucleobacter paneuropaeus]